MQEHSFSSKLFAVAAVAIAFTAAAQAQNNQSFVSTTGNDTNACTSSAYCRTIVKALTVTNSGGEIVVVDSGNYYGTAAITISQPVSISAVGVEASIIAPTGNAIVIDTAGNVTLNGLNVRGRATGNDGILVEKVGNLRVLNTEVQNFAHDGIHFLSAGSDMSIYNSQFVNNGHDGVYLEAADAHVYIAGSGFDTNTYAGADSAEGKMTIADSSAHYNGIGFFAHGGSVSLSNDRAIFNTTGLQASATGHLRFANCLLSDNTTAYVVAPGGVLAGTQPGTTLIAPGETTHGTLSTGTVLQ
jgi:hypothetical protein